jgi:hypothetical protein
MIPAIGGQGRLDPNDNEGADHLEHHSDRDGRKRGTNTSEPSQKEAAVSKAKMASLAGAMGPAPDGGRQLTAQRPLTSRSHPSGAMGLTSADGAG